MCVFFENIFRPCLIRNTAGNMYYFAVREPVNDILTNKLHLNKEYIL